MVDYGAKISNTGKDVLNDTGKDLLLSSQRTSLKLNQSVNTTTITTNITGLGETTVSHGQSFSPVIFAVIDLTSLSAGVSLFPFDMFMVGDGTYAVDDTNIYFTVHLDPEMTFNIYYFISETESAS